MEILINELYRSYSDEFGLITNVKGEHSGDNGIVYTAQFIILCEMLGYKWKQSDVKKILQQFFDEDGIRQRPDKNSKEDPASLDNVTAIMSLSYTYKLDFHKDYKIINTKVFHPRDLLYFTALKYPKLQWLLIPQIAVFLIDSCQSVNEYNPVRLVTWLNNKNRLPPIEDNHYFSTKYKEYNDITSYTYKSKVGEPDLISMKFIATSTKLLAFIRFNTIDFKIFRKLCEKIMIKIFSRFVWYEIMHLYFKDVNHANVVLAHEYYLKENGATNNTIQ